MRRRGVARVRSLIDRRHPQQPHQALHSLAAISARAVIGPGQILPIYDNMKTAVETVFIGKTASLTAAFCECAPVTWVEPTLYVGLGLGKGTIRGPGRRVRELLAASLASRLSHCGGGLVSRSPGKGRMAWSLLGFLV
jgi:hypothetical protein